ncbi:MAG: hypothetical protein PSN46_10065 [Gammaproteobacteria bacterium]|nr:hypothetical protein [Gammaproteobacteria bacterium]
MSQPNGWVFTPQGGAEKSKISDVSNYWQAKLAGYRYTGGSFYSRGDNTFLWSSTESGSDAYSRNLNTSFATVYRYTLNKANGFSVRCLKD